MAYSSLFKLHTGDLRSEAEVETRLLAKLFTDFGYPDTAIIPKKSLKSLNIHAGTKTTSFVPDFILNGSGGAAKVIVEAKDPSKTIQDFWDQAASYALAYNKDKPENARVKWLLISNGHTTSLYAHDSVTPIVILQLSDFTSGAPPYVALRSYIKYATADETVLDGLPFAITPPAKLNAIFEDCHNLIHKKEKHTPTDAFFEFCKFVFVKIREDRCRAELVKTMRPSQIPMTLAWVDALKPTLKHPVRHFFDALRDELEYEITQGKKRIFEKGETLNLGADTCRELVKRFQTIDLSSIDEDLNGRMFEVFLNSAVRGRALGQYFTPRPLVDFMTRIALCHNWDVENPPKVIDACCGTAGFLIEVMAYFLSSIRNDTRFNETEKDTLIGMVKNKALFGVEANGRVSRIARINMYLHGDGGSHIFYGDGLDDSPGVSEDMSEERKTEVRDHIEKIEPGAFDLVLTNPPFSMSYKAENEDEERILRQLDIANGSDTAKSNVLFLQRYINLLKPGGEMLIVLDDTVLNGTTQLNVRKWLLREAVILGVHSMPFNAFFKAGANIKTSVLHVRKKITADEAQGHVFMSISNNIGHDNALRDTLERNNLNDILIIYLEWKRTGKIDTLIKDNQDERENLECPEQVWLISPNDMTVDRLDAFYYAPDLRNTWAQIADMKKKEAVEAKTGVNYALREKITRKERAALVESGSKFKYIEIGDVTRYGLITKSIEGTLDKLPTRGEYMVRQGDVLMAINNSSRGTVVLVPPEFDGAICTSGFLVITPKSNEEGHLLWYSLRSELVRKQVYYLAQTASQPELKKDAWEREFVIPIPIGANRQVAIEKSVAFQEHLAALLNADSFRFDGNVC